MKGIISMVKKVLISAIIVLCVTDTLAKSQINNASYVGDTACEPCHKKQTETFSKNIHNNAYTILKDTERFKKLKADGEEGRCLKCHVTGYGGEDGFVDEKTTPELAKVGCESCHGPGSEHKAVNPDEIAVKKKTILRKPNCGTCHPIHSHEG